MILASFFYDYTVVVPGNTRDKVTIGFDFRSLFQLHPGHQIVLRYASITGVRQDFGGGSAGYAELAARLLGKFNETRNITAAIISPIRVGQTVTPYDGITFAQNSPFYAPTDSKILMPPTFQFEFQGASAAQSSGNDTQQVYMTIGYDIEPTRFVNE